MSRQEQESEQPSKTSRLTLRCLPAESDQLCAELQEAVTSGIEETQISENQVTLKAYFQGSAREKALASRFEKHFQHWEDIEARDWVTEAQAMWTPQPVGRRFYLLPEWSSVRAPVGRIAVPMPAGQAFGSGLHASTQIAIAAMEDVIRPGMRVLDVGTGSGILAVIAGHLSAERIVGCDVHEDSVFAAATYLKKQKTDALLVCGSVDALRSASFDVVVANLNATLLANCLDELLAVGRKDCRIVLSGITSAEANRMERFLEQAGRPPIRTIIEPEWVGYII
jgi:ribosomal protein L11 methyltransferase